MAEKTIVRWEDTKPVEMVPGLIRRTMGVTEDAMITVFHAEKGVDLPEHNHPHQQIGYLISGELNITIDGVTYNCKPGDSWAIPGGVMHQASFPEESELVECFSPAREDYMD